MAEDSPVGAFRGLSEDPQRAWRAFLEAYSALILQVIRLFEREEDRAADCYLFVCEHLAKDSFRRLRAFRGDGSASFPTWLRAVVRNLGVDWRRREFGRERPLAAITALPELERAVFRCRFQARLTQNETALSLATAFPGLTADDVAAAEERIRACVTDRQFWLLTCGKVRLESLSAVAGVANPDSSEPVARDFADFRPDPEKLALDRETQARTLDAINELPERDRLLLRLRYGHELTLAEVARVMGMKDAQQADRRIRDALAIVRARL